MQPVAVGLKGKKGFWRRGWKAKMILVFRYAEFQCIVKHLCLLTREAVSSLFSYELFIHFHQ